MKNRIFLVFVVLLLVVSQLAAQKETSSDWLINTRVAVTYAQPDNPELVSNAMARSGFGVEVLGKLSISERLKLRLGLGLDYLGLASEIRDEVSPLPGVEGPAVSTVVNARANLYYLNIPVVLELHPLARAKAWSLNLRSDLSVSLGGNTPPLVYPEGRPALFEAPMNTVIEQPGIVHFVALGIGYDFGLRGNDRFLRLMPYGRVSTTDVLTNPDRPELNGQKNYWRETKLLEFGLRVGIAL